MVELLKSAANGFWRHMAVVTLCLLLAMSICRTAVEAEEAPEAFTLDEAVAAALEANLTLQQSREEIGAALAVKKSQKTRFFPTFNATYQYQRRDEELTSESLIIPTSPPIVLPVGVARAKDEFTFATTVSQPVFTGFALLNQYKLASLGLDVAIPATTRARIAGHLTGSTAVSPSKFQALKLSCSIYDCDWPRGSRKYSQ